MDFSTKVTFSKQLKDTTIRVGLPQPEPGVIVGIHTENASAKMNQSVSFQEDL